jgi:hypothetical protein
LTTIVPDAVSPHIDTLTAVREPMRHRRFAAIAEIKEKNAPQLVVTKAL